MEIMIHQGQVYESPLIMFDPCAQQVISFSESTKRLFGYPPGQVAREANARRIVQD